MSEVLQNAAVERLQGAGPSRPRALVAAIVAGFGAAVLTYRLLRDP